MTPIALLWTGGWDSTYRLLHLVLVARRAVRPHYLIDSGRRSTGIELATMAGIRRTLRERGIGPDRLLPTSFAESDTLPPYPELSADFETLRRQRRIGRQYEALARYAEAHDVDALELSIHVDDRAQVWIAPSAERYDDEGEPNWRLRSDPSPPELRLFRRFRFPLLQTTKVAMEEEAKAQGFADLMERTWFCHRPRNGRPCGVCDPCGFAMTEGMARRLPLVSRLRYRVKRLLRPTWMAPLAPGSGEPATGEASPASR